MGTLNSAYGIGRYSGLMTLVYALVPPSGAKPVKLVILKKGGEAGDVALNPEHVSFVRASMGAFTDIYCGTQRIAVEGSFAQVVARLQPDGVAGHSEGPPKGFQP